MHMRREIARVEMLRQLKITDANRLENYVDSFDRDVLGQTYIKGVVYF
jgi:hypothetical protein